METCLFVNLSVTVGLSGEHVTKENVPLVEKKHRVADRLNQIPSQNDRGNLLSGCCIKYKQLRL